MSNVSMRRPRRMCLSVGGTRCFCHQKSSMDMLAHNSKVPQISLWYRIPSMPHDLTYSTTSWAQAQMMQSRPALTSDTTETLQKPYRVTSSGMQCFFHLAVGVLILLLPISYAPHVNDGAEHRQMSRYVACWTGSLCCHSSSVYVFT